MLAYLIDPALRRITDIELPNGVRESLIEMRRIVGCDHMDHAALSDRHDEIWCDGLVLARSMPVFAFQFRNRQGKLGPFGGKCIICGADDYGNAAPPRIPREMIENDVDWLDTIIPEVHTITEPANVFGRQGAHIRTFVTWSRSK
jgi:hypothetical protein